MKRRYLRKLVIILAWIAVWHIAAGAVDNSILLVTPGQVLRELASMLREEEFYRTVALSLLRIGGGFLAGFGAAALLASLSSRHALLEEVLSPVMTLLKAVPVASFVVLLLIWWGSSFLAAAVCFVVVLPNIYINTLEGLKNTDRQLLEMARVFRLSAGDRFFYIYRPAVAPFLCGSMKVSLGMCWKSGVAAEVIGTPGHSIGGGLYLSKIYLDTAGVLAWTTIVILLSILFEKGILWLTHRFFRWQPSCGGPMMRERLSEKRGALSASAPFTGEAGASAEQLKASRICKSFDGQQVLTDFSAVYEPGQTYILNSPSGSGKTTLLHMLAGILEPDSGKVEGAGRCSMVFQEDRLCMGCSAVKNVELVTGDSRRAENALSKLLPPEALQKPCGELSGGMKRRVALVRAMEADSDYVLLDEPFTGMDADTRAHAEGYIRERQSGRTILMATHI